MSDELLIENIKALLHLNASNSLVPHGIGNHARDLLDASITSIDRLRAEVASLKEREQVLRNSKRQTETNASDRINTLIQQLAAANGRAEKYRVALFGVRQCFANAPNGKPSLRLQVNNARGIINAALSDLPEADKEKS